MHKFPKNWELRDELLGYMNSPADSQYIEDRNELVKLDLHRCTDSTIAFDYYSKKKGEYISIRVFFSAFDSSAHVINYSTSGGIYSHVSTIDGKMPYGTDGDLPRNEISKLEITWNSQRVSIPVSAFHNLYEPHDCQDVSPEAYLNSNRKLLYLYLSGSDGAGSYSVKLIFDSTAYLSRIINLNECSDGYDFLDGKGSCE